MLLSTVYGRLSYGQQINFSQSLYWGHRFRQGIVSNSILFFFHIQNKTPALFSLLTVQSGPFYSFLWVRGVHLYPILTYQLIDGTLVSMGTCSLNCGCNLSFVGHKCHLSFLLQVQDKSQPVSLQFLWLSCMLAMHLQYR